MDIYKSKSRWIASSNSEVAFRNIYEIYVFFVMFSVFSAVLFLSLLFLCRHTEFV